MKKPLVRPTVSRDPYADFLRSFSLVVVILWHWCFTILIWTPTGPFATSPLGFTSGLWIATWFLQVMPLFFYVGSYVHLRAWQRASLRGERLWHFALRQAKGLLIPSGALMATWGVISIVVGSVFNADWFGKVTLLVISPLWFVAAYCFFVIMMPVTHWLHRNFGELVLVVLAGLAMLVDLLRFRYHLPYVEWLNMVFVWGFAYQLGYFYSSFAKIDQLPRYSDGRVEWSFQYRDGRRRAAVMAWIGFFGLVGLVFSGLYPGSMVGVPGQGSNMAPPTLCILALTMFQAGMVEVIRPFVVRRLSRGRLLTRVTSVVTRFAMPLFLFHTTGMAMSRALEWAIFGVRTQVVNPDWAWWVMRPVSIIGPLLCTLPVIFLFGRRWQAKPAVLVKPAPAVPDDDVGDGGDFVAKRR